MSLVRDEKLTPEALEKMGFLPNGTITPELRKKLLHTPFEFTLIDSDNPGFGKDGPVVFNSFGCPENNYFDKIKDVADLAKKIDQEQDQKVDQRAAFSVFLGDNNKEKGVTDKNDPVFKTNVHDIHSKVIFAILGNHDEPNEEAALAQILHTFVDPATGQWDEDKIKIWDSAQRGLKQIDLAKLRKCKNNWNMFGRYGVLHCGQDGHTDLFALDTTTLASDFDEFVILTAKQQETTHNQIAWLFNAPKKSQAKHRLALQHHPLTDISKRDIQPDYLEYVKTPAQLDRLAKVGITGNNPARGITGNNYSEMLNQIMFFPGNLELGLPEGPGRFFTGAFVTHMHAINETQFSENVAAKETKVDRIPQSGVGSGGPPQCRHRFTKHENVLVQTTDPGFIQHSCAADGTLSRVIYTLGKGIFDTFGGQRVKIENGKIVKQDKSNDSKVTRQPRLEEPFIQACKEFQTYLAGQPKQQPKYPQVPWFEAKTGKTFDWVPNFYEYSDGIPLFLNSFEPHTQQEIEQFLKQALTACNTDPNEQYHSDESRSKLEKAWVYVSQGAHFETLKRHQKIWKEIFEKQLLAVFGMKYEDYIKASTAPKATFIGPPLQVVASQSEAKSGEAPGSTEKGVLAGTPRKLSPTAKPPLPKRPSETFIELSETPTFVPKRTPSLIPRDLSTASGSLVFVDTPQTPEVVAGRIPSLPPRIPSISETPVLVDTPQALLGERVMPSKGSKVYVEPPIPKGPDSPRKRNDLSLDTTGAVPEHQATMHTPSFGTRITSTRDLLSPALPKPDPAQTQGQVSILARLQNGQENGKEKSPPPATVASYLWDGFSRVAGLFSSQQRSPATPLSAPTEAKTVAPKQPGHSASLDPVRNPLHRTRSEPSLFGRFGEGRSQPLAISGGPKKDTSAQIPGEINLQRLGQPCGAEAHKEAANLAENRRSPQLSTSI